MGLMQGLVWQKKKMGAFGPQIRFGLADKVWFGYQGLVWQIRAFGPYARFGLAKTRFGLANKGLRPLCKVWFGKNKVWFGYQGLVWQIRAFGPYARFGLAKQGLVWLSRFV